MKLVSLLLCASGAAAFDAKVTQWLEWKEKYGFTFSEVEDQRRYGIFDQNRDLVREHNQDFKDGKTKFTLKLNKFAALTIEEFREKYLTKREPVQDKGLGMMEYKCPEKFTSNGATVPTLLSYSQGKTCALNDGVCEASGVWTTYIKDQGDCGSCWTFGTTAAIEGSLCKEGRYDCSTWSGVSAQEFVDCASHTSRHDEEEYVYNLSPYDNGGCNGGFQSNALRYVMMNEDSMMSWDSYPYTAGGRAPTGGDCKYTPEGMIPNIMSSCGDLSKCSETTMAQAINELGVVTVGMDASGPKIMLYESGIYSNDLCRKRFLDHAVSLTGFGVYPYPGGSAYWEMRNSWSEDWGMDGYMMMEKDTGDQCGFTTDVQFIVA